MIKKGIATVAQQHYAGYASDFSEKDLQGEKSLQTQSPQGEHKDHCAKLNWSDDAVAVAEIPRRKYILLLWLKSPIARIWLIGWYMLAQVTVYIIK